MSLNQGPTQATPNSKVRKHPSVFEATTLVLTIILSVIGAIIGLELITRVGSTPNTSIIGALFAIIIARIPIAAFKRYKDINRQSLVQTSISGATFSAANGLLMPIAIPFLMGRDDLILPMLFGAILAVITDASILYKCFDSKAFPATGAWPPGIATARVYQCCC